MSRLQNYSFINLFNQSDLVQEIAKKTAEISPEAKTQLEENIRTLREKHHNAYVAHQRIERIFPNGLQGVDSRAYTSAVDRFQNDDATATKKKVVQTFAAFLAQITTPRATEAGEIEQKPVFEFGSPNQAAAYKNFLEQLGLTGEVKAENRVVLTSSEENIVKVAVELRQDIKKEVEEGTKITKDKLLAKQDMAAKTSYPAKVTDETPLIELRDAIKSTKNAIGQVLQQG